MEMFDKRRLGSRRSWSRAAIDAALRMRRSEHKARDAEGRRIGRIRSAYQWKSWGETPAALTTISGIFCERELHWDRFTTKCEFGRNTTR